MKEFKLININQIKINIIEGEDIPNMNAIIIHIHGLGGHFQPLYDSFNSFDNFTKRDNFFNLYNFKSFGLEFHGHGKSEGYRCSIESFDDLLDDLHILITYVESNYYNIPIFLLCESMGCAVALKYCITKKNNIKGIIFLAPLFGIDDDLLPNCCFQKILLSISYCLPFCRLLSDSNGLTNIISTNQEFLDAKKNNKYTYNGSHRLCTGRELLKISNWIKKNGHLLKIPIQIFHGLKDYVTQPEMTEEIFNKMNTKKELHLLEDAHHCLLIECKENPLLPNIIIQKSVDWIKYILQV